MPFASIDPCKQRRHKRHSAFRMLACNSEMGARIEPTITRSGRQNGLTLKQQIKGTDLLFPRTFKSMQRVAVKRHHMHCVQNPRQPAVHLLRSRSLCKVYRRRQQRFRLMQAPHSPRRCPLESPCLVRAHPSSLFVPALCQQVGKLFSLPVRAKNQHNYQLELPVNSLQL
jgi:hypothetical protein